ncbi:M15 family metallopeptidase [Leucobacter massiliensis]|uniref:D-alanyl-D-alanine carboxypeptidase-like core domain-containing protein n=1 Tax=Leucobacter massiliensis TaxID=1686285 RepID=A0A2S9QR41_9MICO|nr:M15 family metallopeptidase [Leucobacter massiliensis]PRI12051.1 hypothetical protein B4915_03015 [Leucobacter massiliensis]
MTHPTHPRSRPSRRRAAALTFAAVALTAVLAALGFAFAFSSTPGSDTGSGRAPATAHARAVPAPAPTGPTGDDPGEETAADPSPGDAPGGEDTARRRLGESGETTAGAASPFGDAETVTRLDPALLSALRQAATEAQADGVQILVTSGWRSSEEQEELLRQAIAEYGSPEEAARWVATPQRSEHVKGTAVDLGPADATAWLSARGGAYGLCQIYANESWHFELRPEAVSTGCPPMYADPTEDPRMQP